MPKRVKSDYPLANANPGDEFVYTHPSEAGYGEHALGQPLTAEMTELDLQHGMITTVVEMDQETGWPLVSWTDTKGIGRITTVDPDNLALFVPSEPAL
jgi:hypothetical protein